MESSASPQPDDPQAALAAADAASRRLTAGMRLPGGTYPLFAGAVAVQLGTAAYGIAAQTVAGLGVVLAGLALFFGVAAILLHRFRRLNGASVDGLATQIVFASGGISSLVYLGALAAGIWAAFAAQWWLVALAAVLGGIGCAIGIRIWWRGYRHDPAAHARGTTPRVLAALAVAACVGFVVLMVVGR
jgi:hypothetical protein